MTTESASASSEAITQQMSSEEPASSSSPVDSPDKSGHRETAQPAAAPIVVSTISSSSFTSPDPVDEFPVIPEEGNYEENLESTQENDDEDGKDNETDATAESAVEELTKRGVGVNGRASSIPIVSTSKRNRPPYKYDPSKITLRFLFANRDGLTVTIECDPSDTVGDVKLSLLSVWPQGLPECSGGEGLRLVCMGRGYLTPDTKTLEDCQIPTFKTHPTPVNVSLKPDQKPPDEMKKKGQHESSSGSNRATPGAPDSTEVIQGCSCVLL